MPKHNNNQINQQLLPVIVIPGVKVQLKYRAGLDEDSAVSGTMSEPGQSLVLLLLTLQNLQE